MPDLLYNIFIFPIVQIIEISFVISYRIFDNKALSIIGVSAVISLCTMPLYFIAEKRQAAQREQFKNLKPKIDRIKAVFKGDERYMILSAFYSQNHYHPVYALRNSFSILIQIPFFLAAYSYLSHLDFIKNTPFLFINDLGSPDNFFTFAGFSVNILPFLMFFINCFSALLYSKGFFARDKIQIYGIALIFFVLLYNSPSALVLYWTANNVFSLLKNIISKSKHSAKIIYISLCAISLSVIVYIVFYGLSPKRIFVAGLFSLIFFIPLLYKFVLITKEKLLEIITIEKFSLSDNKTYILSCLILFILCGLVIPVSLIASSVQEFSFLESYTTPFPFIYNVLVQSAGLFLFLPLCVYFLFSKNVKYILTYVISIICVFSLASVFLYPGDFGYITTTFKFSAPDTLESNYFYIITSSLVMVLIFLIFSYLLLTKRKILIFAFQLVILTALSLFSIINIYKINKDFTAFDSLRKSISLESAFSKDLEPVFNLSRNGKNVLVLMLDSAISGFVPYIFEERPELNNYYSGFTWYPNCISFGLHTRIGAPPVFGGYEYEPKHIQKNRSYAMRKHNEALLMLPRIFSDNGYKTTVTDPSFANYSLTADISIFNPYPQIKAVNIVGKYTSLWLRSHPDFEIISIPRLLNENLLRFSIFKISLQVFRVFIYDKGRWLKPGHSLTKNQLSLDTLDNYTSLDYLPLVSAFSDDAINTYTAITNDLPHSPTTFQYPDYIPVMEVTNRGKGPFATDNSYHSIIASILLTGNFFKFLQENNVYDNTRIIIVSDHGGKAGNYTGNILLPSGQKLSGFHSLLLFKDFNSKGNLFTDNTFMTQADVSIIATKDLIKNPVNPFSGKPLTADKDNGVTLTTANSLQYTISDDQWIHVKDNIFDIDNWTIIHK